MKVLLPQLNRSDSVVVTLAYQPIIIGYFAVVAMYYAVMTGLHFWVQSGSSLTIIASVSTLAFLTSIYAWKKAHEELPIHQFEMLVGTVNLTVLANILAALHIQYDPSKLVYFIMMTMIFALASASIRQALISIIVTLACLYMQIAIHDPSIMKIYGFVGFAAALGAVSIAYFLRRAIWLALDASSEAQSAREYAETRLAKAVELSETMRLQSMTDVLTGLPNRRGFFSMLAEGKVRTSESDPVRLVLLDLDGFKTVNDSYGHNMGDELLKQVASRLREHCGENAHVSRVGGDEFSIVYFGNSKKSSVEHWSRELLEKLAETYLIEDRLIQISGSIGYCEVASDETDAELLQKADFALIHAKRNGKNRSVVFEGQHAVHAEKHFQIERALRTADFDQEIELVFQPQFDLAQQKYVGAEALARWCSPDIGTIDPGQFIKIAEETGLIANITTTVVRKAIEAQKQLNVSIPLSVNLSAYDLNSSQAIDDIIECLHESGFAPELLEFEITESAMMSNAAKASANLQKLVNRGHSIALDDFGTGYSNFNYLRTMPIDKLKVDRSFLGNIADPMTERVLRSLVSMAKTLNVPCLIEGVENELELALAKRSGISLIQGFLFGRPMNIEDLRAVCACQEPQAQRA